MKVFVFVKPNKKKSEIRKIKNDRYEVSVTSPAREGKANKEIQDVLSEYFSVSKSNVSLLHGRKAKEKVFEVTLI